MLELFWDWDSGIKYLFTIGMNNNDAFEQRLLARHLLWLNLLGDSMLHSPGRPPKPG